MIRPTVIAAFDDTSTTAVAFEYTRRPVTTDIEERSQAVVFVPNGDNAIAPDVSCYEVAGIGHVGHVSKELPPLEEERVDFQVQQLRIRISPGSKRSA